jgi:RNA polymerase sigma-70 factor (ECF subfamily)
VTEADRANAEQPNADHMVQLLTNIQQQLTRYVRTLVPNLADADEVVQEANLFVWRHLDDFEPGTNFAAWTHKIAYYQVLTYRKRKSRSRLYFSDSLVEQLDSTAGPRLAELPEDNEAVMLDQCVDKLAEEDRTLLELRYEPDATAESVARQVGRSVKAVYHALGRIRTWLLDCMERTAAERRKRQ